MKLQNNKINVELTVRQCAIILAVFGRMATNGKEGITAKMREFLPLGDAYAVGNTVNRHMLNDMEFLHDVEDLLLVNKYVNAGNYKEVTIGEIENILNCKVKIVESKQ